MFVPQIYRAPDPTWTRAIIRGYPLALLATNGLTTPYASHTPIIFASDAASDIPDDLIGSRLMGHLNRANPQWQEVRSGREGLLVFCGPHSYISPIHYGFEPAAPTWDFAVVHIRGPLTPIDDQEVTLNVVLKTVRDFEGKFGNSWNPEPSLDYFRTILPGVGAFSMEVRDVESMFKFSQEQTRDTRSEVARALAENGKPMRREVSDLIIALSEHENSTFEDAAQGSQPFADGSSISTAE